MAISSISFAGSDNQIKGTQYSDSLDIPYWVNSRHPSNSLQRMPKEDEFLPASKPHTQQTQRTRQSSKTNKSKKHSFIPLPVKTFTAGAAMALLISLGVIMPPNRPMVVTVPFDSSTKSIAEIAELYGCDKDFILSYNGIESEEDTDGLNKIKIPTSFDYIQAEIEELQNSLYSSNLSPAKRDEIADQINALRTKQEAQSHVAKAYTDGKYVYYVFSFTDENGNVDPNGKINVETFKELFDIEDGAIRASNRLSSVWKSDYAFEGDKGYYDYTGNSFGNGDVIKIRTSGVEDDIDVTDYIIVE